MPLDDESEDRRPRAMTHEFEFKPPATEQKKKVSRGKDSSNFLVSENEEDENASETEGEKLIF